MGTVDGTKNDCPDQHVTPILTKRYTHKTQQPTNWCYLFKYTQKNALFYFCSFKIWQKKNTFELMTWVYFPYLFDIVEKKRRKKTIYYIPKERYNMVVSMQLQIWNKQVTTRSLAKSRSAAINKCSRLESLAELFGRKIHNFRRYSNTWVKLVTWLG